MELEFRVCWNGLYVLPALIWQEYECHEPGCGGTHQSVTVGWICFALVLTWGGSK